MDNQERRKQRTLEFMGWMLAVLLLLFCASWFTINDQPVGNEDMIKGENLKTMVSSFTKANNGINTALTQIDGHLKAYIQNQISSPTELKSKTDIQFDKIDSFRTVLKLVFEIPNIEATTTKGALEIIGLADINYKSNIADKKERINCLTGEIACTEAMKAKCNGTPTTNVVGDDKCPENLQKLKQSISGMASTINSLASNTRTALNTITAKDKKKVKVDDIKNDLRTPITDLNTIANEANDIKKELSRY